MSERDVVGRIESALSDYGRRGPSGDLAIDLAAALREARDLLADLMGDDE